MSRYTQQGGKWLAACRSWIQSNCQNGSTVIWGSDEVLETLFTARKAEELAAEVADAAFCEADKMTKQLEELTKENFRLKIEIDLFTNKY